MPRKKNDQNFIWYDERKKYYDMSQYFGVYSGLIDAFVPEEHDTYLGPANDALNDIEHIAIPINSVEGYRGPEDDTIHGIRKSESIIMPDYDAADNSIKRGRERIRRAAANYNGPFKNFIDAQVYFFDPANGDNFRMVVENPSMELLGVTFGGGPLLGSPLNIEALRDNEQRLGDVAPALEKFFGAIKDLTKVQFERQKDEDKGIDRFNNKSFSTKYVAAVNKLVEAYTELQGCDEPEDGLLNDKLAQITNPTERDARNYIEGAVENLRGQAAALENGWLPQEIGYMGFLYETKAYFKFKGTGGDAQKDVDKLIDKYAEKDMSDINLRRNAMKEIEAFGEKYKNQLESDGRTLSAAKQKKENFYNTKGKTRTEQVKDMLNDLKAVNKMFRSSDNFREIKTGLEELHKLAKEFDAAEKKGKGADKFKAYQEKVEEIRLKTNKYILGKKKENEEYKKKNNGNSIPRKEYTKQRMSFAADLLSRLQNHIAESSKDYTLEYNGTPEEMAFSAYKRIAISETEYREKHASEGEWKDKKRKQNMVKSFLRSVYAEKMKVKYETDPEFSAEDFYLSLKPDKLLAGQNEIWETYKKSGLENHLLDVIDSHYDVDADDYKASDPDMYSEKFREMHGGAPEGLGHAWVMYETEYMIHEIGELAKDNREKKNAESLMKEFGYKKDEIGKLEKHIEYKDEVDLDIIYDLAGDINDDESIDNPSEDDDMIIDTSSKPKETKKKKKPDPNAPSKFILDKYEKNMFSSKVTLDPIGIDEYRSFNEKKLRQMKKTYEENMENYKSLILTDSDKMIFRHIAERKTRDTGSEIEKTEIRLGLKEGSNLDREIEKLQNRYDRIHDFDLAKYQTELNKIDTVLSEIALRKVHDDVKEKGFEIIENKPKINLVDPDDDDSVMEFELKDGDQELEKPAPDIDARLIDESYKILYTRVIKEEGEAKNLSENQVETAINDWENQKEAFKKSISEPPEFMKNFEQRVRENPSNVKLNEREVLQYRDLALAKCSRTRGTEDKATNELYKKFGISQEACEKKLASAEKLQKMILGKI